MREQTIKGTQEKTQKTYTLEELETTYFQDFLTVNAVKRCIPLRIRCNTAVDERDGRETQMYINWVLKDWLERVGQHRGVDGVSMYLRGNPWTVRQNDQPDNADKEENIITFSQLEAEVADYL